MAGRRDKGFYARFLGGFSLYYEGRELWVGASLQNISTQILLMLLKAGDKGAERRKLLELIRPEEPDRSKRLNNFRQQVHILRRRIASAGFPEGEYMVLAGDRYHFSPGQQIETDTDQLDRLVVRIRARRARKGQSDRKELDRLYMAYCKAYTGEFLPMLGGEAWVVLESAFYQKWYFNCLEDLCRDLKREGAYPTMLKLCATASQIHPYDGWQAEQIGCLLAMGRYKEALEVYEKAADIYYKDLGVTSLERMMESCRGTGKGASYMAGVLTRLKKDLEEDGDREGPYLCSYPSFQDICRIMVLMDERDGTESQLLLCTLVAETAAGQGCAERNRARAREQEMELLRKVLLEELRPGDAYTRYSQGQFLVLLAGTDQEAGQEIVRRLEDHWALYGRVYGQGQRAEVRFMLERAEGSGDGEKGDICRTYHRPGECHLAGAGDLAGEERDQELQEPAGADQTDGHDHRWRGAGICLPA